MAIELSILRAHCNDLQGLRISAQCSKHIHVLEVCVIEGFPICDLVYDSKNLGEFNNIQDVPRMVLGAIVFRHQFVGLKFLPIIIANPNRPHPLPRVTIATRRTPTHSSFLAGGCPLAAPFRGEKVTPFDGAGCLHHRCPSSLCSACY